MPHALTPKRTVDRDPGLLARASGSVTVLALDELAARMLALRPPATYRLSLDSGVEYKNVRRALEHPGTVRVETWLKLMRSLRIRTVAAARPEDLIWPGEQTLVVALDSAAWALVRPSCTVSLRAWRMRRRWSRRQLALRAGISVDAVDSLESGRGLMGNLARVCQALGLHLLCTLPPWHASLEDLWSEQAARCLARPAHYVARRRSAATGLSR